MVILAVCLAIFTALFHHAMLIIAWTPGGPRVRKQQCATIQYTSHEYIITFLTEDVPAAHPCTHAWCLQSFAAACRQLAWCKVQRGLPPC